MLAGVGLVFVFAVSGVVSFFCAAQLLSKHGRLGSFAEFEWWRLVPFTVCLALALGGALFARSSLLVCARAGADTRCSLEQRRLLDSTSQPLPVNGLTGSEVEERTGSDAEGFPRRETRLVLLTTSGRHALTDFGQADAHALRDELEAFRADPARTSLSIGQDNRWWFYPPLPMWVLLALFALLGRW